MIGSALILLVSFGCSEYHVREADPVPVAEPPGRDLNDQGQPPDWTSCATGLWGRYANMSAQHPDVEPGPDELAPEDYTTLDWWDDEVFARFDPSLELGQSWWPVDEGLAGDPAYFAVRWNAWLRVYDRGTIELLLASAGDVWVILDGEVIAELSSSGEMLTTQVPVEMNAGQFPLEIRYASRSALDSGLRFRVVTGEVDLCMPDYSEDETE